MSDEKRMIMDMGILSDIAYSEYGGTFIKIGEEISANEDSSLALNSIYTVIDHTEEDVSFDMQAILLRDNSENKYIIAFRGTAGGWDIAVDALHGLFSFNPQVTAARDFVIRMMTEHSISPEQLTLTGHSLGGILTQAVGADLGIKGYAYNPYGAELLNKLGNTPLPLRLYSLYGNMLQVFGIGAPNAQWAEDNLVTVSFEDEGLINGDPLSNMATDFSKFVAGNDHYGAFLPIIGIDNVGFVAGHSIVTLNSALADYDKLLTKFARQSPDYKTLSGIFITTGVQNTLRSLVKVVGGNDFGNNRELFNNFVQSSVSGLTIDVLDDATVASLLQSAQSNQAYLFALLRGNSFAITGNGADYNRLNHDGSLEATNYSEQFLTDRALYVYHKIHADSPSPTLEDIDFNDLTLDKSAYAGNGEIDLPGNARYTFGTTGNDTISGSLFAGRSDHLYGMDGNDTISGAGGNDYIEGGKGQDTMYGGSGDDTFFVMGEGEDYDIFIGGDGTDTILGSANNDIIRVQYLYSYHAIESIDGGGGINVIAGTGGDDFIDLTGIRVANISLIQGGWGDDRIIGTAAGDRIYGGENNDTLKGMAGNDTLYGILDDGRDDHMVDRLEGGAGEDIYYIGAGDIVVDSDYQGTLFFNGKQLATGALTQIYQDQQYYENADNSYRATLDTATGTLRISAGYSPYSFSIENFSSGNYGIALKEYQPPPDHYNINVSGSSHRDEMGILDLGPNSANYRLVATAFSGDGSSYTLFNRLLSSTVPNLQIAGGNSGDYLFGFAGHDQIDGGGGNDIITGYLGSWNGKPLYPSAAVQGDLLVGGAGNDWIGGSGGNDQIHGGEDNDIIQSYDGNDHLSGDAGNDVLAGGSGNAVLMGGAGDDALFGDGYFTGAAISLDNIDQFYLTSSYAPEGFSTGYHSTNFFVHNDAPAAGNDFLDGGPGRDLLRGGGGIDTLLGGEGHDSLSGGIGEDRLEGGSGNDLLIGDNEDQVETAGDAGDYLYGGFGNDYLYGMGGNDFLSGDADEDYISGGSGQDFISGGSADDTLWGDGGDDTLSGNQGNDVLWGNQGDDSLDGGSGNDYLDGGDGNDVYQLGPGSGYDRIVDTSGSVRLHFAEGITAAQIRVSPARKLGESGLFEYTDQGSDLWVEYTGSDAVYIENGMGSANLSVKFANGEWLTYQQLSGLLAESQEEQGNTDVTTRPRVDAIANGSFGSMVSFDSVVMGNGYDAYNNAAMLQGFYKYFKRMRADLTTGELPPGKINLGSLGGAASWMWNVADLSLFASNHTFDRCFSSARAWRPTRSDPLALDLDGNGLETVGTAGGVLFDHNGDGINTGTGWVGADDGFLVRDNNGNDLIDNASELFGDQTVLQDGTTAMTGFAALTDLDSNVDGKIDAADEAFADLKSWQDLNQDGISQASELNTLTDLGIAAIDLGSTSIRQSQNGNDIVRKGTMTLANGQTNAVFEVNLASNLLSREFTDQIDISEPATVLPELPGGGKVRNLQEAATLSPELQDILTRYTKEDSRTGQMDLVDELLIKWADTSGMTGSLAERVASQYRVEYLAFGDELRSSHLTEPGGDAATDVANAENTIIDEDYRRLIRQWDERIHVLEAFNGTYFFELPGQSQEGGGAVNGMGVDNSGYSALFGGDTSRTGLAVSYSAQQLDQLEASYQALRQSVYDSLSLQTRLKKYLDRVELVLAEDSVSFDFSRLNQSFLDKIAAEPTNGLADLIEFNKYTTSILSGTSWDGVVMMEEILRSPSLTLEQEELCRELGVRFNGAGNNSTDNNIILGDFLSRSIRGGEGNDILLDGSGNSSVTGGKGDDIISGGGGDDRLFGEAGDDTYIFRRGSGNDVVRDFQGRSSIVFAGLNSADLMVLNSFEVPGDLNFRIKETGETLTVNLGWKDGKITDGLGNNFFFSDGTAWDIDEALRQSMAMATEGDDVIVGSPLPDSISGLAGDDILTGNSGDDILDGGPGNDTLRGGDFPANGNDTYLFGRGYGQDIVSDKDTTLNTDRLKFKDDILPGDVIVSRDGSNLVMTIKDSEDRITLEKYFIESGSATPEQHPYEIEHIEFTDGTDWTSATIRAVLLAGSENPETIIGYRGDDVITGLDGDDTIYGFSGNDNISGGSGNDMIYAGLGNDIVDGGAGDDFLLDVGYYAAFYDDNDTYMFGEGDGHDTIRDFDWKSGNEDTLLFKRGVLVGDVFFERIDNSSEDLLITLGDGTDSITVKNWFGYNTDYYKIERFGFADGTVLSCDYVDSHLTKIGTPANDVLYGSRGSETLFGLEGDDTLYGRDGDDSFDGGRGDDVLEGGRGNDEYLFNRGSGRDTVIEDAGNLEDIDTIILGADILPADVTLRQSATDLIMSINGTEDLLMVKNFFSADGPGKTIEQLRFADGQVWNQSELQLRAIVMTIGDETSDGDDIIFGTPNVDTLSGGAGNDVLFGLESDDYLDAGAHRDWLDGGAGNDSLYGGSGDDILFGGAGDDSFFAGPGNDAAWGGSGGDTYVFNAGDGTLIIEDYLEEVAVNDNDYGGGFDYGGFDYGGFDYGGDISPQNILQFGPGIILSELVFSEKEGYLIIDIPASGDQIRLAGYAPDRATLTNAVDLFRFADGTIVDKEAVLAQGAPITGTSGDDVFSGTAGNDYLAGGSGNDQYTFNIGNGIDTIVDISTAGMENSIDFGSAIRPDDIQAVVESGTLVLRVGVGGDAIRFAGYDPTMAGMPIPVGQFTFDSGYSLSFADLLGRGYEIVGTPEKDDLLGTAGNDRIRGLGENDLLSGGTGDDTYLFAAGDGVDTIDDIAGPGEGNMVVLPDGSAVENIRLNHDLAASTLIVSETVTENEIHLTGFDRMNPMGGDRAVQYFQFGSNGIIVDYEELLSRGFDIFGGEQNDRLFGTAIMDRIEGGAGDDLLAGGTGNDFLAGGDGNDTYVFNPGDGIVHIKDHLEPGFGNTLRFGPGIAPLDLQRHLYFEPPVNASEGAMIIAFDNGDEIWLAGFNPDDVANSPRSVDTFVFDDGTTLSFAELAAFTFVIEGDPNDNAISGTNMGDRLYGRDGDDTLAAGTGDDVLTGGAGSDEMAGGAGRDVYAVGLGDGGDQIIDGVENGIGNTILFGEEIDRDEIVLIADGSTLTIRYGAAGDQVQIANFDPAGINGSLVVDTFAFADGSSVRYQEFINRAPIVAAREQVIMWDVQEISGRLAVTDPDSDMLFFALQNAPSHGSFIVDGQGAWRYSADPLYVGADSAIVKVGDGDGGVTSTILDFEVMVTVPVADDQLPTLAEESSLLNTYIEGSLSLPEQMRDTLYLKDIGKADLAFTQDGDAMTIAIRNKGSIRVNGYFSAPDSGMKRLETSDGPVELARDHIGNTENWGSVLNNIYHGLVGDKLSISGTAGANSLLGGAQNDVLLGGGGDDAIMGLGGDDLMVGGSGKDKLFGNGGNDTVYGDQGNDTLSGGTGNDFLIGGAGNDNLTGGSQNDHLNGGQGCDILTGGSDADTFVFDTVLDELTNKDTIVDFVAGQDKVALDRRIFTSLSEEDSLFSQYFHATSTGTAGDDNDYLLYNTTTGALLYDMDGSGQGVAVEFAHLVSKPELTAKDFVLAA